MTRGLWLKTLILVLVFTASAHAQSSLGIGTAEPGLAPGGPLGGYGSGFFGLINQGQQDFYRALTTSLKAMRADPWQLWSLIGLSFAYGIFHAAGPGHGKAVISSYMIANETALRRGIVLAFLSAFLQGAVAVLLIVAGWLILRGTSVTLTVATRWMELASFALVIAFGLRLLFRKIRALTGHGDGHDHHHHNHTDIYNHHHHDHSQNHDHHHHDHTEHRHDDGRDLAHHGHDHFHAHGEGEVCAECGHMHMPDPALLKKRDFSLQDAWSAVVAVGMRPCSGALLVLTFSLLNGLYLGGILSVIAMSFGTALTVSALAILAVSAKGAALRLTGAESRIGVLIGHAIEIGGALLVILLGSILLIAGLAG